MKSYLQAVNTQSDINEHVPVLSLLAENCKHITELGVRSIVSTWGFAEGLPRGGKLVCYDIAHPPAEDMEALSRYCIDKGVEFKFHLESSLDVTLEETDLLFIDTIHTYEQLSQELKKHGGVAKWIVLHDTVSCAAELWPAIAEFMSFSPYILKDHYGNNNGLTVLERTV